VNDWIIYLAWGQAVYYVVTGIWPIFSMRSFMAVTGPKTDQWLVKTVGLLIVVIGATIGVATWRESLTPEIVVLAVGSAAMLTVVDVAYSLKGRISKIYLLDAIAEVVLIVGWLAAALQN
jgi:hypothetical protein